MTNDTQLKISNKFYMTNDTLPKISRKF